MKTPAIYSVFEKLPRPGQLVMIEAASGRCAGFLDPERGWCDVRDGHIIENVESWSSLNIDTSFGEQPVSLLPGSPPLRPEGTAANGAVRLVTLRYQPDPFVRP